MCENEPNPEQPTAEKMLQEILRHNSSEADPRFVQFSPDDQVRLFTRVTVGENLQDEHSYESILIGTYDTLEELYAAAKAEDKRDQKMHKARQEFLGIDISTGFDDTPMLGAVDMPIIEELEQFIREGVSEQEVVEAAKEVQALREISGVDEDTLVCNSCDGEGKILVRDGEDEAKHPYDCAGCDGKGSIKKYPEITVTNPLNGESVTLDLNVTEIIATGEASIRKDISANAYDNGLVEYTETTWVLLNDYLERQLSRLGIEKDSTALLVDGNIYPANLLKMDLRIATSFWKRNGSNWDFDPGEITSARKTHTRNSVMGSGKPKDYTAHELLSAAQQQVAYHVGAAFSEDGFTPQATVDIEVMPLEPVDQSLKELRSLVKSKGYSLGYTYMWYGGDHFAFSVEDDNGEVIQHLCVNRHSFRMAVENAKHKLSSGES